jgi:hypothetical protein
MCFTAGRKATLRQMRHQISVFEAKYQEAKRQWQECPTAENNAKMIRAEALVDDQMKKDARPLTTCQTPTQGNPMLAHINRIIKDTEDENQARINVMRSINAWKASEAEKQAAIDHADGVIQIRTNQQRIQKISETIAGLVKDLDPGAKSAVIEGLVLHLTEECLNQTTEDGTKEVKVTTHSYVQLGTGAMVRFHINLETAPIFERVLGELLS